MDVTLLSASSLQPSYPPIEGLTPSDSLIAYAIADCYQVQPNSRAILRCLASGHDSVFEHLSFTFRIKGISRACLAQLTRHRIASFTVESQRYVNYTKEEKLLSMVVPDSIANSDLCTEVQAFNSATTDLYSRLVASKVPPEDARFVLPNAATTNLTVTFNARSLMNAFNLRLDPHSQWEIRKLFTKIYHIVCGLAPTTFSKIKLDVD